MWDLPFIFSTGLYVLTWMRSHFKSLSIHCLSLLTSRPLACTEALIPPMCWCEVVHAHQHMQSQGKCHQLEQNIYCHCGLKQKESASLVLHEPSPPVLRCSLCRQLLHSPYHCRSHQPGWGHSVWRPLDKVRMELFERCCVCLLTKLEFFPTLSAANLWGSPAGASCWKQSHTGWMGWWWLDRKSSHQSGSPCAAGQPPTTSPAVKIIIIHVYALMSVYYHYFTCILCSCHFYFSNFTNYMLIKSDSLI